MSQKGNWNLRANRLRQSGGGMVESLEARLLLVGLDISNGTVFLPAQVGNLTAAGERYLFTVNGRNRNNRTTELWSTDGTIPGTRPLKTFPPVTINHNVDTVTAPQWAAFGPRVLFTAGGPDGAELWISDGTPGGTRLLADINPGPRGSYPHDFLIAGSQAYFVADDGTGWDVWATDGSTSGAKRITDLPYPSRPVGTFSLEDLTRPVREPKALRVVGDQLYFIIPGDVQYNSSAPQAFLLYRTDLNSAATTRLADAKIPRSIKSEQADYTILDVGGRAVIQTRTDRAGIALFSVGSDGAVTLLKRFGWLEQIFYGGDRSAVSAMAGDRAVIVTGQGQIIGTDGTFHGTQAVGQLPRLPLGASRSNLVSMDGSVFLTSERFMHHPSGPRPDGIERWLFQTDGTLGRTREVDYFPAISSQLHVLDGAVYGFAAEEVVRYEDGRIERLPWEQINSETPAIPSKSLAGLHSTTLYPNYPFQINIWHDSTLRRIRPLELPDPTLAAVGGVVYRDLNRDGIRQRGEPRWPGIRVWVDTNNNGRLDGTETSTRTDSLGRWFIGSLQSGVHAVRLTPPGTESAVTTPHPRYARATIGQTTNINFGIAIVGTAQIRGHIFNDANRNGVRDADEEPLAGHRVFIDRNGNGVFNTGERFVRSDAQGAYAFTEMGPGTYRVIPTTNKPWVASTEKSFKIKLADGATHQQDIGLFNDPHTGVIRLAAFIDKNDDGKFNALEPAPSLTWFYIDSNNNGRHDDAEPSVSWYDSERPNTAELRGLPGGRYIIRAELQSGYVVHGPTSWVIDVPPGGVVGKTLRVTAANFRVMFFGDSNHNGIRDESEPIIDDVNVQFLRDGVGPVAGRRHEPSPDGFYGWDELLRGNYTLRYVRYSGTPFDGELRFPLSAGEKLTRFIPVPG